MMVNVKDWPIMPMLRILKEKLFAPTCTKQVFKYYENLYFGNLLVYK